MKRRSVLLPAIGVSLFVLLSTFGANAQTPTGGGTLSTLERTIQEIEIQIAVLQTRLNEARGALQRAKEAPVIPVAQAATENIQAALFTRLLAVGSRGDDVKELQKFLSQFPDLYPEQLQTGFYGPRTAAAVRKFQEQQGIEVVGNLGPKTLARIQELLAKGAGASGTVPPGLTTAPGIQKQLAATTTVTVATSTCATNYSLCYAKSDCEAAKFFWYTVSCHPNPPRESSCTASYSYCSAPAECAAQGWYWCRNSCYGVVDACLGQTYTPPAVSAPPPPSSSPASTASATTSSSTSIASSTSSATTTTAVASTTTATATSSTASTDTIAPSVPANLTATAFSSTQINLSWSTATDNVGVTGYRVYRNGNQIVTSTGTAYSDNTGLATATTYSYAVAAYDATGNLSSQSTPASATTFSAGPPAPTNFYGATSGDVQSQPPRIGLYLVWKYALQSATKAFNVYMKKPSDAAFTKYTYSDPANLPIVPGWLPLPVGTTPSFYRQPDGYMWRIYDQVADTVWEIGKYEFYVTVADTSGTESVPTAIQSFIFYRAPTIVSPANGSTVSITPRITITEDLTATSLGLALYKKNNGWIDVPGWWPAPRDFTYNGPALTADGNPHYLVAYSVGSLNERSLNAVSIFNVSTTTSLKKRTENLAAISEVVGSLNAALDALIQLLKRF